MSIEYFEANLPDGLSDAELQFFNGDSLVGVPVPMTQKFVNGRHYGYFVYVDWRTDYPAANLWKALSPSASLLSEGAVLGNDSAQSILDAINTRATPADVSPTITFSPTIEAPIVNPTPVTVDSTQFATALDTVLQVLAAQSGVGFDTTTDSLLAIRKGLATASYTEADRTRDDQIGDSVAKLGKAQLVVMSPVLANGNARVTRGGDYFIDEGRSLDFNLTGPTILAIRDTIASITFTIENAFTILNVSHETIADGLRVRVELTSAQTLSLASSSAGLQINAIMQVNGHALPLLQGTLTVDKAIV